MPRHDESLSNSAKESPSAAANRPTISSRLDQFDKRQRDLWFLTFFLLVLISIGFAIVSWISIKSLALRYDPLLLLLFFVVALFISFAWERILEISDLLGL